MGIILDFFRRKKPPEDKVWILTDVILRRDPINTYLKTGVHFHPGHEIVSTKSGRDISVKVVDYGPEHCRVLIYRDDVLLRMETFHRSDVNLAQAELIWHKLE